MQNKKTPKKNPKFVIIAIALIYFLFYGLPFLGSGLQRLTGRGGVRESYELLDLRGVQAENLSETEEWKSGALKETVPELKSLVLQEDCRLYRFQVTVKNTGTKSIRYDGAVYLNDGDGYVSPLYYEKDADSKERDTRILPPGREAVITLYGQVSDDSSTVGFTTYKTETGDPESIEVDLFDSYEEDTEISG